MTVELNLYGVRQLYLFEITDLDAPTYATGVQAKCVRNVQFAKRITEIMQKGDDHVCFVSHNLDGLDFTLEFGGTALDLDSMVFGHGITEDAGPPVTTKVVMSAADVPGNFGVIAKVNGKGPGGSAHIELTNCVATGDGGYNQSQNETLAATTYSGISYPLPGDTTKRLGAVMFFAATDQAIDTTWADNDIVS